MAAFATGVSNNAKFFCCKYLPLKSFVCKYLHELASRKPLKQRLIHPDTPGGGGYGRDSAARRR